MNQPGKYDRIIDIKRPATPISDGAGGWLGDGDYTDLALNVWADIAPLSGQRLLQFHNVVFTQAYEIKVFVNPDYQIRHTDKLYYKNSPLTIHRIVNEGEDDWELVILAYAEK